MTSNPAYSPCEPALGWSEMPANPVHLREPGFELLKHLLVTARLFDGRERMNLRELGPRDGEHLGGGVELHRA
jgi:hypothetical protein